MLDAKTVSEALGPILEARGLFLVEVKISKDNDVTVTVESSAASVTLDDCEAVNRSFTGIFDQDAEDYSLTVTSAGLDGAFKVSGQYAKAIGSEVEVWLKGGRKFTARLLGFSDESLTTSEGEYDRKEINKVKYHIEF